LFYDKDYNKNNAGDSLQISRVLFLIPLSHIIYFFRNANGGARISDSTIALFNSRGVIVPTGAVRVAAFTDITFTGGATAMGSA
jgi:hypothetical protein